MPSVIAYDVGRKPQVLLLCEVARYVARVPMDVTVYSWTLALDNKSEKGIHHQAVADSTSGCALEGSLRRHSFVALVTTEYEDVTYMPVGLHSHLKLNL